MAMHFQFDMSTLSFPRLEPAAMGSDPAELLRQLVEVQREQLMQLRALTAMQNPAARWRAFLARWRDDFPGLPEACQQAVPVLERTYNQLVMELSEHVCQNDNDALTNEFGLQEFLDRYGARLAQLGAILNSVIPLAEASAAGREGT